MSLDSNFVKHVFHHNNVDSLLSMQRMFYVTANECFIEVVAEGSLKKSNLLNRETVATL